MQPILKNQEKFRACLNNNHIVEGEYIVDSYKVLTKKPNIIWSQSIDQTIGFGWIYGIKKSIKRVIAYDLLLEDLQVHGVM